MSALELLTVEDAMRLLGWSERKTREMVRTGRVPHRVLPHSRRIYFDGGWLAEWADGAELERIELAGGGRIVRPIERTAR